MSNSNLDGQPAPIAASTSSGGLHESSDVQIRYLYHEPQLSSLCGVHALNNLLQGPYFGAGDLAEIGARIDAAEARLLHGAEYADRPLSARHVDVYSGDFSIEVLRSALEEKFALRLFNTDHEEVIFDVASAPEAEEGYFCHRQSHWFALRSVGGLWFSVDSRLPKPRLISDETLRRFIAHLKAAGGTAFVLRPAPVLDVLAEEAEGPSAVDGPASRTLSRARARTLPPPKQPSRGHREGRGHAGDDSVWHPIEHVVSASTEESYLPERIGAPIGDDDESAAAALAAAVEQADEDSDARMALMLSLHEAEAAGSAWRAREALTEAAHQGSMTGRSRALLTSLGSAISRPFSYSAGGTGHQLPLVVPAGTTGYAGGPPPEPPPAKGWELLHAQDGRPYYHHRVSSTTTWKRPAADPHDGGQAAEEEGAGQSQWWPATSDGAASSYLPTTLAGAAARPLAPGYPPPTPPSGASARGHASHGAGSGPPGQPRPARGRGRPAAADDSNAALAWALEQSLSKGGGAAAAGSAYNPRDPFPRPAVQNDSLSAPQPPESPPGEDPELTWALAESLKASGGGGSVDGGGGQPVPRQAYKAGHAAVDAAAAPLIVFGPD